MTANGVAYDMATDDDEREGRQGAESSNVFARAREQDVPNFYFNDFATGTSHSDAVIVLQRNGEVVALLNASYTTMKTLADSLDKIIKQFEEQNGQTILTIHDIDGATGNTE